MELRAGGSAKPGRPPRAGGLLALLVAGLLAACSAQRVPPSGPDGLGPRYGYSQQKLAEDRYRVGAAGPEGTSAEVLESYLLFRAARLALAEGFEGFRVLARDVEAPTPYGDSAFGGVGNGPGVGGWGGELGRPLGYAFLPGPLYNPGYLGGPREAYRRPFTERRVSADLQLLEELPDAPEPGLYDARDLLTQLAPAVNDPGSLAD